MKKIRAAIIVMAICSMSAFADSTTTLPPQTAIVKAQPESSQQSTPIFSTTPITFNPLTTTDTRSGLINPNSGNGIRTIAIGGFIEGYWGSNWVDSDKETSDDNVFVGGSLTFTTNDFFSTTFAIGAMFDGKYLLGEVAVDYNFKPYIFRESNGVSTSGTIGKFGKNGPILSNTESVYGHKHTMRFAAGLGVLINAPLKENLEWFVTPRLNLLIGYSPENLSKLCAYAKFSPGVALGRDNDKKIKSAFYMGATLGVKYSIV